MSVREIPVAEAAALRDGGAILVDVREPGEWALGSPVGALRIPLATFVEDVGAGRFAPTRPVVTLCASGRRSLLAAEALERTCGVEAVSLAGGFAAWREAGQPWEVVSALDADARERYARHLLLPEVGEAGQLRLAAARVLVVGAGGLGSPVSYYLAAAGIGRIRLVDDDRVDRSNLQRQILHRDDAVGRPKVESARTALLGLNPRLALEGLEARVDARNVSDLIDGCAVVVDGSDNLPTRYLLNDACVRAGIPLVYGAVHRFEGQVAVFAPGRGPCYRCLFPEPPPPEAAPNCAEAGVLGVVPGVIGLLQATEAVKLVLGVGEPLIGRLLGFDARAARFREVRLPRDPQCPACGDHADRSAPLVAPDVTCAAPGA